MNELHRVSTMIGSVLEPGEVMARTLEGVGRLVANQGACIYLIEGNVALRSACLGETVLLPPDRLAIDEPPIGQVLEPSDLAPIAEELYFRGYVFRSYLQTQRPWVAYGATSILFSILHLNLPALLPILVLSVLLCMAYRRTGSIIPSIVGHAVNNTAAFAILYFTNGPV